MTASLSQTQTSVPMTVVAKRTITLTAITSFVVIFGLGDYWLGFERWQIHYWADGAGIIVALFSGLRCLHTANSTSGHDRTAWRFFGLACLIWFVGMLIWSYYEIVERIITPFPALSDVCFLASPALFIIGGFYYKSGRPQAGVTLKHAYDLGIVFCATLIATTTILFEPIQASTETWLYLSASVAYAVFYISAFLFALFWLWMCLWGEKRRVYILIILGLGVLAFVHTLYALALLGKTYESGHYTDIFWIIGFAIIYWAAFEGRYAPSHENDAPSPEQLEEQEKPSGALISGASVLALLTIVFLFRDSLNFRVLVYLFPVGVVFGVLLSLREWWIYKIERALRKKTIASAAAQRESEERYARAVAGTNDGIWDWNVQTGEDYFSPRWEEILGYDPGEIEPVAQSFIDLIHAEDSDRVSTAVRDHLENRAPYDIEFRLRRKNGGYVWVRARGQAVWGKDGTPLRMAGSITDITDRKRAEEALRDSEASLLNAQRIANLGNWDWNIVTGELHWSDEIYRIFGLEPQQFGATYEAFLEAVHPDDRDLVQAAVDRALSEGEPYAIDHRIALPDGEERIVHEQGEVIFGTSGKPLRMNGTVQDITGQRRAQEELRDSEQRFRSTFEQAAVGIAHVGPDGRWLRVNQRLCDIVGYTREELIGLAFQDITYEDDLAIDLEFMEQVLAGTIPSYSLEKRYIRKDRSIVWINLTVALVRDAAGEPNYFISVIEDISKRKQAEQEVLELNEGLERRVEERTSELRAAQEELLRQGRLATLGQLTATVSHELRNPLGVIRTSAFILRDSLKDVIPRVGRSMERIERSVVRCDRIIDELLDFTRISGLEPESAVFDDWLAGVLDEQVLPEGIVLRRDFGLPGTTVTFDRGRLRRAVINIFDNACQAMLGEEESKPVAGENSLTVRTRAHAGRVEVVFEDQGSGIPAEVFGRIFEPLFSTKGFGVGLGLPVVKQIMEQHGGGIEVETEVGRGTTVRLWLDPEAGMKGAAA